MGIFQFFKDAGEKIFCISDSAQTRNSKITDHVRKYNIPGTEDIEVNIGEDGVATVTGQADSARTKQLVLVAAGNIQGVKEVNDQITVSGDSAASSDGATSSDGAESSAADHDLYEVKPGDTLSKIAQQYYGDSDKYNVIFEANQPLLTDPDKIYPGQTLIIPKQ